MPNRNTERKRKNQQRANGVPNDNGILLHAQLPRRPNLKSFS